MRLSIVTINYNNQEGLARTVQSVINQLNEDIEYIIIDGKSTDGSLDIIYENIGFINKWVSEPDKGIYHAMNKGVQMASGDWVLFMNSGDLLFVSALEKVFREDLSSFDIIYGQNYSSSNGQMGKLVVKDWVWTLLSFMNGCIPHQSTFTRRSLLLKYPFHEEYCLASCRIFFIETIIFNSIRYKYFPIPISIYDINGASLKHKSLLLSELDDFLNKSLGSCVLSDLKELQKIKSISDGRALNDLLVYSSGRPRLKSFTDWFSSMLISILRK